MAPWAWAARSAVIAETMLPARAGDDDRGAFGEAAVRVFLRRTLDQADRPAQVLGVTDLDRAGIAQGLLDQEVGERRLLVARTEVHGLDQRALALARERLGEAGDGAAHDRLGAGDVVAVTPPEPRGGDEERLGVQPAHERGEQLDAPVQAVAPIGGVEVGERALAVERRQPVDAVDRAVVAPALDLRRRAPRRSACRRSSAPRRRASAAVRPAPCRRRPGRS